MFISECTSCHYRIDNVPYDALKEFRDCFVIKTHRFCVECGSLLRFRFNDKESSRPVAVDSRNVDGILKREIGARCNLLRLLFKQFSSFAAADVFTFTEETGNEIDLPRDSFGFFERVYKLLMLSKEKTRDEETCIICMDNELKTCWQCKNKYHKRCIDKWIKASNVTCPYCRCSLERGVVIYFANTNTFISYYEDVVKKEIDDDSSTEEDDVTYF